jgi:hypothetical protein
MSREQAPEQSNSEFGAWLVVKRGPGAEVAEPDANAIFLVDALGAHEAIRKAANIYVNAGCDPRGGWSAVKTTELVVGLVVDNDVEEEDSSS